jgi:hypothetical protein
MPMPTLKKTPFVSKTAAKQEVNPIFFGSSNLKLVIFCSLCSNILKISHKMPLFAQFTE